MESYECLTDAVLCWAGHGSAVDSGPSSISRRLLNTADFMARCGRALDEGHIDVDPLRRTLAGLPLPGVGDGRLVLAVDLTAAMAGHGDWPPRA